LDARNATLDEVRWYRATVLFSLEDAQAMWALASSKDTALPYIHNLARKCLMQSEGMSAGQDFKLKFQTVASSELNEFVCLWFAVGGNDEKALDEIVNILFAQTLRNASMNGYFSEITNTENFAASLLKERNSASDENILRHMHKFEYSLFENESNSYDRDFVNKNLLLDPFVDLSYPLYKGYLYKSMIYAARLIFSEFLNRSSVTDLVKEFQRRFGPLHYPEIWEILKR
jgi:hypothetical protein